jgi:superfamily II DNA/RNA helicase
MIERHHLFLDGSRYVVLDEADEMLDLGFLEDVETILRRCPMGRQTALFSATIPPEIQRLADTFMHDPVEIRVRAATLTIDTVDQFYVEVPDGEKPTALVRVLREESPRQAIVFVRTKVGVDRLARRLGDAGVRVKALHGDMTQGQRDGVMIAFKSGRERLLVATDVAARGLDITGVSHVVNYDIPNSPDVYVHRIGRTGRAGESGRAVTLITPKQRRDLEAIKRHARAELEEWSPDGAARERALREARGRSRPARGARAGRRRGGGGRPHASRERRRAPRARAGALHLRRGAGGPGRGGGGEGERQASPGHRAPVGGDETMSQATMHTNHGAIDVELFADDAPKTVENFLKLSRDGYYDGLVFHRVIKDFMIQGGCPQGTGTGGPGYEFEDEINDHKVARGALAMANRGPDTNGSQFFIVTTAAAPWLDGKHTVFGRVEAGMEVVDAIEALDTGAQDRPHQDAVIDRVEVHDAR